EVGTKEITLSPSNLMKNKIEVEIGTAGSIGLLLQPIQIACLGFNLQKNIEILVNGGGTFGKWAPSLNYLQHVTYNIFRNHGFEIDIDIQKHGFYPKGGAMVKCTLFPPKDGIKPINFTKLGNLDLIQGEIISTSHLRSKNVCERIKKSAQQKLEKSLGINVKINYQYVNSLSPGVGFSLWTISDIGAIISSGSILGEKNISSEDLGIITADKLITYIKKEIPVDNFLSDQLIPFMAFHKGPSKIKVLEITSHAKTNLELIKLFLGRNYQVKNENTYSTIEFL
ncbi:MAG: RNA 3'-terminal phosphate cyclase, partial [Candidatus Thorarchaeota archaeon]